MLRNAKSVRTATWWKASVAVLSGLAALSIAGGAQADNWKKHKDRHHYYEPDYVVVTPRHRPRTVYVVPEPVMVYPQPYSYGPSYPPSVNFNFSLPMR
jgi:hypothetical protein